MKLQTEAPKKLWTRAFLALTASSFLLFLNLQMLLAAFPAYVKGQYGADDLTLSLFTSVFALAAIFARFMTAGLMRKIGREKLLYSGFAIGILMTAIYVLAHSIESLLLMRIGFGLGFGMASTIIPTLVSQSIPGNRVGEGIGYFGLSTSLAMSVGPLIGLNVMKEAGFGALTVVGTVTLLLAIPVLLLAGTAPSGRKTEKDSRQAASGRRSFNKQLIFPAFLNVLLAITYGGVLSFISLFGESVHLEQVGLFFLFNVVTILIVRPISGKLFDRKGHAVVLVPAAFCIIASLSVLSLATTMPVLILSALLYGLGFGAIQPTLQAWLLRSSAREQHGVANSLFYNSTDLGVALGAFVLGVISSASNYAVMYRYSAGFMVLFLVAYTIAEGLRRRNEPATQG
jgi:MFS family permease